jgi:hypothetical protein
MNKMAKLTVGQKAQRVVDLLLGLRNPRIASALTKHGFTNEDLAEGWTLLQRVTRTKLDALPGEPPDPSLLRKLDEWENDWFPIAIATLQRRAPQAYEALFRNLSQTEGPEVVMSVTTFIERLERLDQTTKELLHRRGLTSDVVGQAKQLLSTLGSIAAVSEPQPADVSAAEFEKAENDLWAWYLEWSEIARTAIKQKQLLRAMGFRRDTSTDDPEETEPESPPTVSPPTVSPQPV